MATVEKRPADLSNSVELPLLRFGLRQLLGFVAGLSVLFATLASTGRLAGLVLLLGVLVVLMHVFATTLGGRLRARADRLNRFEAADNLPIESIATATQRH